MATAAQLIANRLNARKSTGPKTEEGKANSRLNALTHGLTAEGIDMVINPVEVVQEKEHWKTQINPVGPLQESLFEQVVIDSIRVKRCHDAYFTHCDLFGQRAILQWDQDRFSEAEHMLKAIHKTPGVITRDLEKTPQGASVKVNTWTRLLSSLKAHKTWTDPQRELALDLLGFDAQLRDAETPIDPLEGDIYEARVNVVVAEIARLEERIAGPLTHMDALEQGHAARTIGAEATKPLMLIDRYERAALKRRNAALKQLKSTPAEPESTQPAPVRIDQPCVDDDFDQSDDDDDLGDTELDDLIANLVPEPAAAVTPVPKAKKGLTRRLNRRQRRALEAVARKAE